MAQEEENNNNSTSAINNNSNNFIINIHEISSLYYKIRKKDVSCY